MIKTIIIAVAAMIFAPLGLGGTAHPAPGQAQAHLLPAKPHHHKCPMGEEYDEMSHQCVWII